MIEFIISLCAKAAAAVIVAEVKKEVVKAPLKAAVELFAGWDEEGKLQLDKLVKATEGMMDIETAVEDALALGKSRGVERVWDTMQVATALVSTSRGLSNIMREPDPIVSLRKSAKVQPNVIPSYKFPTFNQERRVQRSLEPVHKPPMKRRKKAAKKTQRQQKSPRSQTATAVTMKRLPGDW